MHRVGLQALLGALLAAACGAALASPQAITLIAQNSRSSGGTLSTWVWKNCNQSPPTTAPCYNYSVAWTAANIDASGSTATWTWDNAAGILASSGLYITTNYVNSNPNSPPPNASIVGDRVVDLSIDTINGSTTASNYRCIDGVFLAQFGSRACANVGDAVTYNFGGNAYCIQAGFTPAANLRGLTTYPGSINCSATYGAFAPWTVGRTVLARLYCRTASRSPTRTRFT
jgi:hypothetical protein